jgi:hypothetical protein
MKTLSKAQLISLWICSGYFGLTFLYIFFRACWGFLRLASEYKEEFVPTEVLFGIAESAAHDFWRHAILVGIGFVILLIITIWITIKKVLKR